jgi:signal transduction histidine kinase
MAGVCMDITERKRAEEELTRHRDRLEELVAERTEALRNSQEQLRHSERLASIGTFAAGIAHEINNPLNHILLTAQFAQRFMRQEEYQDAFGTIAEAAQRGGHIVQNILKFAKADSTAKLPEDPNEVVRHAAAVAQTYLAGRSVNVDIRLAPALPPIEMNTTEIEQVMINLIKNAAESADGIVHVRIGTERDTDVVRLTVEDDGPGIPEEDLPYIFDPFFSTKRKSGGTGLGLSICHGIIADHRGSLTVDSKVGRGTTFRIELPVAGAADTGG